MLINLVQLLLISQGMDLLRHPMLLPIHTHQQRLLATHTSRKDKRWALLNLLNKLHLPLGLPRTEPMLVRGMISPTLLQRSHQYHGVALLPRRIGRRSQVNQMVLRNHKLLLSLDECKHHYLRHQKQGALLCHLPTLNHRCHRHHLQSDLQQPAHMRHPYQHKRTHHDSR